MITTRFSAPDIECGGCAASIQKALSRVEGIASLEVDVDKKTVAVSHDEALVSPEAIAIRLDHIGFPATVLSA